MKTTTKQDILSILLGVGVLVSVFGGAWWAGNNKLAAEELICTPGKIVIGSDNNIWKCQSNKKYKLWLILDNKEIIKCGGI
jgi:hypothetical protein